MKKAMIVTLLAFATLSNACYFEMRYRGGAYWDEAQNVAQLDDPPYGCEDGPLSVALVNDTDFYLQMTIDGVAMEFMASDGWYDELPPWTTAYLCLENLGFHTLTGVAFVERYGELRVVQGDYRDFSVREEFGADVGYQDRHEFWIDPSLLYYH